MKKKTEPKSVGPLKEEEFIPWSGITLNRCLAVAAIAALLSVGFQVLQEAADSDDLAEDENEVWPLPESSDQQSDPWFFEGWFGSSTTDLSNVEEPEAPETVEPDVETEEEEEVVAETEKLEESVVNEQDITNDKQNEEIEIEPEPTEPEKKQVKQEQKKQTEQWGLKSKEKYMETKAIKIRIADKDAPFRESFPFNFAKKPKESGKPSPEKEKSYKDKKHQLKYEEKKYDHPNKEYEKPFKKEKDDKNKYFKQEKGKKDDKDYKGQKQYKYEKDYKKKHDSRHHG